MALRRAHKIMVRDDGEEDPVLPEPEASSAPEPSATPLFLERREGGERRQAERRGLDSLRTEYQRSLLANTEDPEASGPTFALPFGLKPWRLALVLVAVVAGGVAAYLAMGREPAAPMAVTAPIETPPAMTQVLVAKSTLTVGQRLTPDAVEWQSWPNAAMRPEYMTEVTSPNAAKDLAGRMVRATLYAGEPIRPEKLAAAGGGLLSSLLDKGMRGVSVLVSAEAASGGFILPGDRVDVVLTLNTADGRQALQTILRSVRVLAINANLGTTASSAPSAEAGTSFSNQAIATLELDDKQSEVIIRAGTMGKLSLTLRAAADAPSAETPEQQAANAAIRISSPFWTK